MNIEQKDSLSSPDMEKEEVRFFTIERVKAKEAERLFEKIEIEGDEFEGQKLTAEILREERLLPKHRIKVEDAVVWFSSPYEFKHGYVGIVAYVETDEKLLACSYYLSSSQGVWRYLPDYFSINGSIKFFGKGFGEESVTLPFASQKALAEISSDEKSILKIKNPQLVMAGTTKRQLEGKEGRYYREKESESRRLQGSFHESGRKLPPEKIILNKNESPDFSKMIARWNQDSSLYGEVSVEIYPSKDGRFKFMFCRDNLGRVWIGGIEDDSEITSSGLKKSWVSGGNLTTPAYEYDEASSGYGNRNMRNGVYVDMYGKYLSKIPVIEEYNEILKKRKN